MRRLSLLGEVREGNIGGLCFGMQVDGNIV